MRKLAIGIAGATALMFAGILAWNAEATTLTSAATIHTETNDSLVEKAGCWLPGFPGECEIGQQRCVTALAIVATALLAQVGILGGKTSPRIRG